MQDDRDRLLEAALTHVPFEGMNDRALLAGARDLGMSPDLARVHFPQGGASLAAAYHRQGDAALARALAAGPRTGRIRDRIADAIWQRLALADPELVRAGATVRYRLTVRNRGGRAVRRRTDPGRRSPILTSRRGSRSPGRAWGAPSRPRARSPASSTRAPARASSSTPNAP